MRADEQAGNSTARSAGITDPLDETIEGKKGCGWMSRLETLQSPALGKLERAHIVHS